MDCNRYRHVNETRVGAVSTRSHDPLGHGGDGGGLVLMQRIAIESMVRTAIDTAYIKQCTCEGAQGAWGKCSCHVAQRLMPGSGMRSMRT